MLWFFSLVCFWHPNMSVDKKIHNENTKEIPSPGKVDGCNSLSAITIHHSMSSWMLLPPSSEVVGGGGGVCVVFFKFWLLNIFIKGIVQDNL